MACRMCPDDVRCELPLDCTDRKAIQSLVDAATQYIEENREQFDRICEVLCCATKEETPDSSVCFCTVCVRQALHWEPQHCVPKMIVWHMHSCTRPLQLRLLCRRLSGLAWLPDHTA